MRSIQTDFTKLFSIDVPVIAGPMFLVSDENLVSAVSQAGGIGGMPSLNWRTSQEFRQAVQNVKQKTDRPFAINLIVNKANRRQHPDLTICAEEKVPLVITSLGNPKGVIEKMHAVGGKVFCDVTTLDYAKKVQDLGADGVIAVSAGAGGHAGPTTPFVLLPHLVKNLSIPVVAAGGIATGQQLAAALLLGASAVQIGTRFIASQEAMVDQNYKNAIVKANPSDIVMTERISGTPAAVIKTAYIEKVGLSLNPLEKLLYKFDLTKKYTKMIRYYLGSKMLEKAASRTTWKEVWSAGQGVGMIDNVLPVAEIMENLNQEYFQFIESFQFPKD